MVTQLPNEITSQLKLETVCGLSVKLEAGRRNSEEHLHFFLFVSNLHHWTDIQLQYQIHIFLNSILDQPKSFLNPIITTAMHCYMDLLLHACLWKGGGRRSVHREPMLALSGHGDWRKKGWRLNQNLLANQPATMHPYLCLMHNKFCYFQKCAKCYSLEGAPLLKTDTSALHKTWNT